MRMSLRQKFYPISHDSSTPVNTFIEAVLSNHDPSDEEIMPLQNHALTIEGGAVVLLIDHVLDHVRRDVYPTIPGNHWCRDSEGLLEFESRLQVE